MSRILSGGIVKKCATCGQLFVAGPNWEHKGGRYEVGRYGVRYYCLSCSKGKEVKKHA